MLQNLRMSASPNLFLSALDFDSETEVPSRVQTTPVIRTKYYFNTLVILPHMELGNHVSTTLISSLVGQEKETSHLS
jgi:hypothetical protein